MRAREEFAESRFHLLYVCMCTMCKCSTCSFSILLGRCLQHRGGEPERAKGADGMQLFALDCIAYIVDADRTECLLVRMICRG